MVVMNMMLYGLAWASMTFYYILWPSMTFYECPDGSSLTSHDIPWSSIKFHDLLYPSKNFYDILWHIVEGPKGFPNPAGARTRGP